jgi:hypothetical protein
MVSVVRQVAALFTDEFIVKRAEGNEGLEMELAVLPQLLLLLHRYVFRLHLLSSMLRYLLDTRSPKSTIVSLSLIIVALWLRYWWVGLVVLPTSYLATGFSSLLYSLRIKRRLRLLGWDTTPATELLLLLLLLRGKSLSTLHCVRSVIGKVPWDNDGGCVGRVINGSRFLIVALKLLLLLLLGLHSAGGSTL